MKNDINIITVSTILRIIEAFKDFGQGRWFFHSISMESEALNTQSATYYMFQEPYNAQLGIK